jgi:hypothetical protein
VSRIADPVLFALTAAYVALLPYFYQYFNKETRFTVLWSLKDYAAIITAVAAVAAVLGIAYALFYLVWKPPAPLQIARDAVLVILLAGLFLRSFASILSFSEAAPAISECLDTRWAKATYCLAIPFLFVLLNARAAKRVVRGLYAMLIPLMGVGLVWPLAYKTFDAGLPPLPPQLVERVATGPRQATTNVYIFMMDEWSYGRTFPDGRLIEPMPHLRELLSQATLYRNVRSAGTKTAFSVPRFLFQNNSSFLKLPSEEVEALCLSGRSFPGPTLFSESPGDWFRVAVGFWIDYRGMLATNVDFAITTQSDAADRTFWSQTVTLLKSQQDLLRDLGLITKRRRPEILPALTWVFGTEQTHRLALETIDRVVEPTFGYFHYCLPHYPYVWEAGGKKNPMPKPPMKHTVASYRDNILYVDTVIGEVVTALHKAGKFDDALLVITSDHSWRYDPDHPHGKLHVEDVDPESELRRVPLIVKLPGQTAGRVVDDPVSTLEVHRWIRAELQRP